MFNYDHYSDHMGRTVTATEAKARILALLDEVEAGDEVEITRHGRLIARLVPARGGAGLRGRYAGMAWTAADNGDALMSTGEPWDPDGAPGLDAEPNPAADPEADPAASPS